MLKTLLAISFRLLEAYHLGEGRVLKTIQAYPARPVRAYHLGEGRVLKTNPLPQALHG